MTALRKAGNPQPESRIVLVTPMMAANWLENHNTHNRDLSQMKIDIYARDMEQGRWQFNGESIQFDIHNTMMNGQHRCKAIVQSGCSQLMVIVNGVASSSQITMDQGSRRTPADQLAIADIKVDTTIASAIRVYMRWYAGRLFGDVIQLKTMADVPAKSPVLALWKKLDRARDERIRYTERDQIAFFVVAWNAFREQRPLQLIQRPPGNGWTRETFPYPK